MEAPPVLRPLVDELHIRSAIDVPLVARERGIGELIVGSLRSDYFLRGDVQTVATSAGQLAAAIEQTTLSSQTDQSLRQRVEQMTTLTRLGRELNNTLDLKTLLQRVYDEALRVTHADCGSILLFEWHEPEKPHATERRTGGESRHRRCCCGWERSRVKNCIRQSLHSLEKTVLEQGTSLIIQDFKLAADRLLALSQRHPLGAADPDRLSKPGRRVDPSTCEETRPFRGMPSAILGKRWQSRLRSPSGMPLATRKSWCEANSSNTAWKLS